MNIIFNIVGGIGKCIAATAVLKAIKTQYPNSKVIVFSQFPNIFKNNPNILPRGLLCHHCNRGMGALKDDPKLLRKVLKYLEK